MSSSSINPGYIKYRFHQLGSLEEAAKTALQKSLFTSGETKRLFESFKQLDAKKGANKDQVLKQIRSWLDVKEAKSRNQKTHNIQVVEEIQSFLESVDFFYHDEPIFPSDFPPQISTLEQKMQYIHEQIVSIGELNYHEAEKAVIPIRGLIGKTLHETHYRTEIDGLPIIQKLQVLNTELMEVYFQKLTDFTFAHLQGEIPQDFQFAFASIGSIGTKTTSPFSDYDFAVVYNKKEYGPLAKQLVDSMHTYNKISLCPFFTPKGAYLGKFLIGTVEDFKKRCEKSKHSNEEDINIMMVALGTHSNISGNSPELYTKFTEGVLETRPHKIKDYFRYVLEFEKMGKRPTDVKLTFLRAPFFYIEALCMKHGIPGLESKTIWQKLELLKESSAIDQDEYNAIYNLLCVSFTIRYLSHFKTQGRIDYFFVESQNVGKIYLNSHYLVLNQLDYSQVHTFENIDEVKQALYASYSALNKMMFNSRVEIEEKS
jgi:hypothetical protein